MDLVRILHLVDTLLAGKHDFNYIYAVGLIVYVLIHLNQFCVNQFILILHSSLVFIQCSCIVMVVVGCAKNVDWCHPFLIVCFLSIVTVSLLALGIVLFSMDLCGFPSFFWHMRTIMMQIAIGFSLCVSFSGPIFWSVFSG